MPVSNTPTRSSSPMAPRRRSSTSPASPADPVWSAGIPVSANASSLASSNVGSSTTTGEPPVSSMARTTATQSYVSSSRMPWATEWGASSHAHMKSPRWVRAWASAASTVTPCSSRHASTRSNARASGDAPVVCTVCSAGTRSRAPSSCASRSPWITALASAPPPTCTTMRSSARPFSFPWHVNGSAPAANERFSAWYVGSPGTPGSRGDTTMSASSSLSRATTTGSASVGTKTWSRRSAARATTAAASAAFPHDAMARGRESRISGSTSPTRSATSRWTSSPMRCRALCDPDTFPVSFFTHTPPVAENPSRSERSSSRTNGVTRNPYLSTSDTESSSRLTIPRYSASARPKCAARWFERNSPRYRRNGFASASARSSGNDTAPGSRTRTRTWSTSGSTPAFGHRNGYGSSGPTSVPQPEHTIRLRMAGGSGSVRVSVTPSRRHAGPAVELLDHGVPHRDDVLELAPPRLVAPHGELLQRDPLLLHPGEVAEVEDPLPVPQRGLQVVVRAHAGHVLSEHLAGVDRVELAPEVLPGGALPFAAVHRGAVRGQRHDHVVRAHPVILRGLDRGQDVADRRQPERGERLDHVRRHAVPRGQVLPPHRRVQQPVHVVRGHVGDRGHRVGVHHVVDEWDVLVADALDVVLAEPVRQHCRAFQRLHR